MKRVDAFSAGLMSGKRTKARRSGDSYPPVPASRTSTYSMCTRGRLWRLIPVDGAFAIYVSQDTYLISPPATGSAFRRLVVTSSYRPLDQSWSEGHKWQIKPAAPSLLERGLDDYFTKDYTAAVDSFTALLEAEKLSPVASIKVYWYRMVASLKLQKKEFFREDGDLLGMIDGCPKYFLEATKDVLGEDLTTIEATELAQYVRSE
ncbi:hypothetical protein GQ600_10708 [Phytophthora cactorum]|nr:hypothetical protein GQ600_10708 [Phytophthora cactorum]